MTAASIPAKEACLRILIIVNLPWDSRLGAVRVWREISEQWQKSGHRIEKFCLTDAFAKPTSSRGLSALRQAWAFPNRAARYVRRHGHRFDIIDCLIGTLPVPKRKLHFDGLLVARSVGLYRSYEHFIRLTRERWPDQPRGKLAGRLFHRFIARHLWRNSTRSISQCDLINLPNEEERRFLPEGPAQKKPVIVQPYGLNEQTRASFAAAVQPATGRLTRKEICFIGMWSLRKGARDWPDIIGHIRAAIPDVRFTFLGTMTDEVTVRRDLRLAQNASVRCIESYEPDELPALLSSCAVGLFPSYIEGFGIAVLEQLACGIPTVAYDVPGPRQIIGAGRPKLLVPPGDVRAMAGRAIEILEMDPAAYTALSRDCRTIAAQFRWEDIADKTLEQYRAAHSNRSRIVFTEPFALASAVGGARILRTLLRDAPVPNLCVCTAPTPPQNKYADEVSLPLRPDFGRIERTRFMRWPNALAPLFRHHFVEKLEDLCKRARVLALHAIAHGGLDFHHAFHLAKRLRVPFFLHVHDDVVYTSAGRTAAKTVSHCLAEAWAGADLRFVISKELGHEYNRRYGPREFVVVTDGLDEVAEQPRPIPRQLRIYFMGLFHLVYEPNLESLIGSLELLSGSLPTDVARSITLRCGSIRPRLQRRQLVKVLPFGSEADVQIDLGSADWLYLPLPFTPEHHAFGAYSLSTKMVTYLGSGIPIIYHGPPGTAAYNLLSENRAAALITSLDPEEIAPALFRLLGNAASTEFAGNALRLARQNFLRREQHEKFWKSIGSCLNKSLSAGLSVT